MNEVRIRVLTAKLNAGLIKQAAAPAEVQATRAADISRGKGVEAINRAIGGIDPRLLLGGVGAVGGSLIGALTAKKRKWLYALLGGAIGGGVGALGGVGYKAWADAALEKAKAAKWANTKDSAVDALKGAAKGAGEMAAEGGKLAAKAGKAYLDASKAVAMYPVNKVKEIYENLTPAEKATMKPIVHPIDYSLEQVGKATAGGMSDAQRAESVAKQLAKKTELDAKKSIRDRARAAIASLRENAPTSAAYHTITGQRAMRNAKGEIIEVEPENKSLFGWLSSAARKAGHEVRNDLSDLSYRIAGSRIWDRQKDFEPDKDVKVQPAFPKGMENIAINDPRLDNPELVAKLEEAAKYYAGRRAKQDPAALKAAIESDRKSRAEATKAAKNAIDLNELWQNR